MTRLVIAAHNVPPARGGIQRLAAGLTDHILPGATTVVSEGLTRRRPPRWAAARRTLSDLASGSAAMLAIEWWPEGRAMTAAVGDHGRPVTAVVVHGTDIARCRTHRRARRSAMRTLHAADVVVAVSTYSADLAAELGVAPTVINPGVDLDAPAADGDAIAAEFDVQDRPLVISVSRLVARKGHADLLAQWGRVISAVPEAVWLIVGDGPEAAALRRAVPPSVRLVGDVDDCTLAALYRLADVHVMPGRVVNDCEVEGFGMAAVEAGAAGTPTIATAVGGTAEAVGDGGVVVPQGRTDLVAAAIIDLLTDQASRDALGGHAKARAAQLDWPRVGQRYREALRLS